jgi:hypothetical protein
MPAYGFGVVLAVGAGAAGGVTGRVVTEGELKVVGVNLPRSLFAAAPGLVLPPVSGVEGGVTGVSVVPVAVTGVGTAAGVLGEPYSPMNGEYWSLLPP